MKKLICLVMTLVLLVSVTGCFGGSKEVKATIKTNTGDTEYLTAAELVEICDGNSIAFNEKYWCADVTVQGEVKEVSSNHTINGTYYEWTVTVDGGKKDWFIGKRKTNTSDVSRDVLASLQVGDQVILTGKIVGAGFNVDISNDPFSITKVD